MRAEEIVQWLQKRPFQPFRLYLSDSRAYEVRHPEMIMMTPTSLVIGLPNPVQPGIIYQGYATVSLLHMTAVEPIAVPISPSSN